MLLLAAAAPVERRVSVRRGWADEKDGLFTILHGVIRMSVIGRWGGFHGYSKVFSTACQSIPSHPQCDWSLMNVTMSRYAALSARNTPTE